jgi:N,N'-diacetylbacillosaminyl-diphospho-undecaprenol alpha-1,3-N-acetylgalactosaminyltransferase
MKLGLVTPDDLSTLIFATQFVDAMEMEGHEADEVITVSSVGDFTAGLEALDCRHIPVDLYRFVHPIKDLRYRRDLSRVFAAERFDAVVTFTTKPNVFGIPVAAAAGVPLRVMAVRGLGRTFETAERWRDKAVNHVVSKLYASAMHDSNFVWFTNQVDRAHFVDRGMVTPERTLTTRNAVNLRTYGPSAVDAATVDRRRYELGIEPGDRVVIMVARLIWTKGVREFAEAAAMVRREAPHVKFFLLAPPEGNSAGAIPEEWVRAQEAEGHIRWLGFQKDVLHHYALSDLAVLPSYYNEGGYPRALLEPMAQGKPVIAADTPVCRGPVEHGVNGLVIPPKDSEALAQAIKSIVLDDHTRNTMGRASTGLIHERFDDRLVAREVLDRIARELSGLRRA